MISEDMCKILTEIPHLPQSITEKELHKRLSININLLHNLLKVALDCGYVSFAYKNPYNSLQQNEFGLTEKGQVEIEDYRTNTATRRRANCALTVSIISAFISLTSLFLQNWDFFKSILCQIKHLLS